MIPETVRIGELIPELARLEKHAERQMFLAQHGVLLHPDVLEQLAPLVVAKIRVDPREALRLAEGTVLIARKLRRKEGVGLALRAKANALHACGDNRGAIELHDRAYEIYAALGNWKEAGRTLSSSIQPLILLGEYDRAFDASEKAREIFTRLGETSRIATLENNVGNIFHRQDRFEEALAHYECAYKALVGNHQWEHAAIALSNMAMCLIKLDDFPRSLDCYQRARELCVAYDMPQLRDQADYNIAYLYYLRGEYSRAIEMLVATRRACEASGNAYRLALCYLDLSDIYIELNLSQEAEKMAAEGFLRFQKLGITYEAAKTLANEAIACGQQGKTLEALKRFEQAREMFEREKNPIWPWLLDLYQGVLLFEEGRYLEARRLSVGAARVFDQAALTDKSVLSHLLLARIALQAGDLATARNEVDVALQKLAVVQSPMLGYQTHLVLGQIESICGDRSAALWAYQKARSALESLRIGLQGEEFKISFVKKRLHVYEALVDFYLGEPGTNSTAENTFECIEAAKSRSMVELISRVGKNRSVRENGQNEYTRRVHDLRRELNWYYHRIDLEELHPEQNSRKRIEALRCRVQSREIELARVLREMPVQDREAENLESPSHVSIPKLQTLLSANSALIEYYSTGDRLLAAIVTRDSVEIIPVTEMPRVAHLLNLLRFQFSKFRMGTPYVQRFERALLRATLGHLEALYREVIAPLHLPLGAQHLVFVPHGPLHFLPFHALKNEDHYLTDAYTISYAPSATVFTLCGEKATVEKRNSLVLGIPDERAPQILTEVRSVASLLPRAELFVGKEASSELLRQKGPETGLLHIATHGIYRQDNPMFSGIRLGDGYLNLYDFYQMRLGSNLVTLSGCATGMNSVAAGDELVGLQRGLFCAGATSLLLSLWDVHDGSTAQLMQDFYSGYIQNNDMASSLQAAMRNLRRARPHPYFWAPFVLVGKIADTQGAN